MRNLNKLLTFLVFLIPMTGNAYFLSQPKLDLYDEKYAVQLITVGADFSALNSDLNAYEKQADGSVLVPTLSVDKNKKLIGFYWTRVSCNDDSVIMFQDYINGSFEKTQNSNGKDLPFDIKRYYCPIITDAGKKLLTYGYYMSEDKKIFSYLGWFPEEMKKNNLGELEIQLYPYGYNGDQIVTGNNPINSTINCKNKTLKDSNGEHYIESDGKNYKFVVNTACEFNDVLKFSSYEIPGIVDAKTYAKIQKEKKLEEQRIAREEKKRLAEEEKQRLLLEKQSAKEAKARLEAEQREAEAERLRIAKLERESQKETAKALKLYEERAKKDQAFAEANGDGSSNDGICKKYGFKVGSETYKNCRFQLDMAQKQAEIQQAEFNERQRQYDAQQQRYQQEMQAAQDRQNFETGMNLLTFGLGLATGKTFQEAAPALSGQPMYQHQPQPPVFQNYTITTPRGITNCVYQPRMNLMNCN